MSAFLTAEWRKLLLINYVVSPDSLKPYLPYGTELDLFQDRCYVSLVGFRFLNTKLKGISIPFHTNFEEVNLRFYVRSEHGKEFRRGVVFIKEIVPKSAITFVANALYGEKYQTMNMRHDWTLDSEYLSVRYEWQYGRWNSIEARSKLPAIPLVSDSEEEFISQHFWGYTKKSNSVTSEYEVKHIAWDLYPVITYHINVDFGKVYGDTFSDLSSQKPQSVFLAEGSSIEVMHGNAV